MSVRLTKYTDYSLRVLLYAASAGDRNTTIEEVAQFFGISHAHLKKVVKELARAGYLKSTTGRAGGFRLAMPPNEIRLGALIRQTEPDFALVECFQADKDCRISSVCGLPPVFNAALARFMEELDSHTLADVAKGRFGLSRPEPAAIP